VIQTQPASSEGRDLKQASRHHHVLEEMDHLVLVGEVVVERDRGRDAEQRKGDRDDPDPIAGDQEEAAAGSSTTAMA